MRPLRYVGRAEGTLTDEEIEWLDTKVVETVRPILIGRSLFPAVPMGHAGYRISKYYTQAGMSAALLDMDGQQESKDRAPLTLRQVDVPVIHKETDIFWRDVIMARESGRPLDASQAKEAARKCAEEENELLLSGETTLKPRLGIEGLSTATGRNTTAGGDWSANFLTYVTAAIVLMEEDGFYGPYKLILPPVFRQQLRTRETNVDKWNFQLVGELIGGVENILVSPNIYAADGVADSAFLTQPGEDNYDMVVGEDMHTISHVERNKNIWLQVREVVAPRIKRPTSICEITALT